MSIVHVHLISGYSSYLYILLCFCSFSGKKSVLILEGFFFCGLLACTMVVCRAPIIFSVKLHWRHLYCEKLYTNLFGSKFKIHNYFKCNMGTNMNIF